jgi:uncharacterized membrane protein
VTYDRLVTGGDPEFDSRVTDRLISFSDAVVSIAITLLAIGLPVPAGGTADAFLSSVRGDAGHYAAFLLSFLVIAAAWSGHLDVFHQTRRVDQRLRQLDLAWLLMIVLIPFATRLLATTGNATLTAQALRFGFYALVQAVQSGILLVMLRYAASEGLSRDVPEETLTRVTRQSFALMVSFGLSIPIFFATPYAWVLWLTVPTAVDQWYKHQTRQAR